MDETIELLGVELPTRTAEDPELVEKSVGLLRDKIDSIQGNSESASRVQVALLAGLNLAGELLAREQENGPPGLSEQTMDRLEEVHNRLKNVEEIN